MTFSISAKIQDGGQNSGNPTFFTGTIPKVSTTHRVQTLLKITLSLRVFEINDIFNFRQNSRWGPKSCSKDKCVFAFYAEIQDGQQKWRQYVHSPDTLRIKNFIKIALSQTVSKINAFLRFMQKFKMAAKNGRKVIFVKSCQQTLQITCRSEISTKSLYFEQFPR